MVKIEIHVSMGKMIVSLISNDKKKFSDFFLVAMVTKLRRNQVARGDTRVIQYTHEYSSGKDLHLIRIVLLFFV